MFGADVDEEDWAERIKQEKMQKLASAQLGGLADYETKAREDVAAVVRRVDGVLALVRVALTVLRRFSEELAPSPRAPYIDQLLFWLVNRSLAPLLQLLADPGEAEDAEAALGGLLREPALECLRGLCTLLEPDLIAALGGDLFASLLGLASNRSSPALRPTGPLQRLVKGLSSSQRILSFRRARQTSACVSVVTISLLQPALRSLLELATLPSGCEGAFTLLDM